MNALFLFLSILLFLPGCQSSQAPVGVGEAERAPILLHIFLPEALTRNQERLARFTARVRFVDLHLESKRGITMDESLPLGQWDELQLPALNFPRDPKDGLSIRIRVWDRSMDGMPRSYPVLIGRAQVAAEELSPEGMNTIPIRLNLKVSVSEYD